MLLQTKLHIPEERRSLIPRPRLIKKLDAGLKDKLTLVSASAGYGKTTLIATWINQMADASTCWLSLGDGDNNPTQYWAYVIASLQTSYPKVAAEIAPLLQGGQVTDFVPLLVGLINEIASTSKQVVLVLDDYHVIQNSAIHETMDFWLANLPTQLHVVIISRSDPPLSLSRWRVRGLMTEIRDTDLRFTEAEAAEFLNQIMGLSLAPEDIAALEKRTEGWIASLQLAALAMQSPSSHAPTPHDFVENFAGSDRYIVDYLVEEVLQQQPLYIQNFLLQTSILERLCSPLCDAILETDVDPLAGRNHTATDPASHAIPQPASTPQQILDYLDTTNLFLIPLDNRRKWYRYHHLFRDLLRYRLEDTYPERIAQLHQQASGWFERNGFVEDAIEHALLAGNDARAADLLESAAHTLFSNGKMPQIQQWMDRLPPHLLTTRPRLFMVMGWLLFRTGQFEALDAHLQHPPAIDRLSNSGQADAGQEDTRQEDALHGEYLILRANNAFAHGKSYDCRQLATQALQLIPPDHVALRMPAITAMAWSYEREGEIEAAIGYHQQAAAMGKEAGVLTGQIASLGILVQRYAAQGRQAQALATFEQVQLLANESGVQWIPLLGPAYLGKGQASYQKGLIDEAIQHLTEGIKRCRQWGGLNIIAMRGYALLCDILRQEERHEEAGELLAEAQQFAQSHNIPTWASDASTSPLSASTAFPAATSASASATAELAEGKPQTASRAVSSILIDPLTARERDVLRLLVAGHLSPQIADELIIGVSTVRTHIKRIYNKLDVHNRTEAIKRAVELALV